MPQIKSAVAGPSASTISARRPVGPTDRHEAGGEQSDAAGQAAASAIAARSRSRLGCGGKTYLGGNGAGCAKPTPSMGRCNSRNGRNGYGITPLLTGCNAMFIGTGTVHSYSVLPSALAVSNR